MITEVEVDSFLEHHGVKGMRWGVRQSRKDIRGVGKTARKLRKNFAGAKSDSERKAVADRYEREVLGQIKSKDFKSKYREASTMTKGEMAVHVVMLGPIAALTIPQMKSHYRDQALLGPSMELTAAHKILKEMRSN